MSKVIGHGFRFLLWSKVDASGTMIGTGAMPTAGAANLVRFGRLYGARNFPMSGAEPQVFTPRGDDGVLTSFRYGADALANGSVQLGVRDSEFEATVQGTKVSTKGEFSFGLQAPKDLGNQDIALIKIRQAAGYPAQNAKWEFDVLPITQITPTPSEFSDRSDATYAFTYNAKMASVTPWGESIDQTTYGNSASTAISGDGPDPIQVFFGIGDGTRVEFAFVIDITSVIGVWVNGTLIDPADYTVDVATSGAHDITFDTAPANGAKVHILTGVPIGSLE